MRQLVFVLFFLVPAFCMAQLTPEQWRADLEYLRTTLPAKHPGFAQKPFSDRFQNSLTELEAGLAGRNDLDIALDLQAILSASGDAHTRVDLLPMLQKIYPVPLGLGWYADGIYVSGTTKRYKAILGKKIVRINGLDTETALQKTGRFVAMENDQAVFKDGLQWFRFPAAFRQAGVSNSDTLAITYEDQPGKLQTIKVFPINPANQTDMQPAQIVPKENDLRWRPLQYLFFLEYLESDKVLYVQYNRCISREMTLARGDTANAMQLPAFQPFADSILYLMRQHPEARLVFDLRFNPGGGASDGIEFARRIAEIPEINRKDRLFVAVNLYTFSSAVQIAAVFDEHTNATLIGDQPAERPNHYGEVRSFRLPNSGLEIVHSSRFMRIVEKNGKALDIDQKITPSFDDFKNGKDPVLDFVRKRRE
ncbi:MAG: hypothetical protein JNL02_18725 [Saprospiraceae bacterium]|nr:hypothetical protein [Saprospiraceae bacterium]